MEKRIEKLEKRLTRVENELKLLKQKQQDKPRAKKDFSLNAEFIQVQEILSQWFEVSSGHLITEKDIKLALGGLMISPINLGKYIKQIYGEDVFYKRDKGIKYYRLKNKHEH